MDQTCKSTVVPMRFYANWDVDRTSSSAIPRTLSMKFTRLVLTKPLTTESALIVAVKLQGHRRILRSNDINIISPLRTDYALDISFTIQYCHFIKRKSNILEIFIQRRKKYKNRQIPGFKTLAFGNINLDEILQQGGFREVSIWDTNSLKRLSVQGTIYISNCYSQVVDNSEQDSNKWMKPNGKYSNILSEEEVDDYSSQEDSDFEDFEHRSHRTNQIKRSRKKIKQKNIKQKVVALLKKFRIPDEEVNASNTAGSRSSCVLPPTELELQEIFEELENISDSGPELEPDKMSIVSNPRPGLRPFFGSKTDILPAIKDQVHSDDDDSDDAEQESSEETQKESCYWVQKMPIELDTLQETQQAQRSPLSCATNTEQNLQNQQHVVNFREKLKHSITINSITSNSGCDSRQPSARSTISSVGNKKSIDNSLFMEMLSQFDSSCASTTSVVPQNIWLSSSVDFPWIPRLEVSRLDNVYVFDCPNLTDVRTAVYAVIARIQKFCNSNSVAPSTTRIGILGSDRMVSHVLRTYVDILQNKCQDWLEYLRFSIITPPSSTIGKFLGQIPFLDGCIDSLWRNSLSRISGVFENGTAVYADYQEFSNCLSSITGAISQQRTLNLPIGEVMLQFETKNSTSDNYVIDEGDNSQIFVPFLSELYMGNADDYINSTVFNMKNSFDDNSASSIYNANALAVQSFPSSTSQNNFSTCTTGNLSPPVSPHSQKMDGRELHVEYWTSSLSPFSQNSSQQEFYSSTTVPKQLFNNATGSASVLNNKFSMKAHVRNLCVSREPTTNLLGILFVKEKKKDKVLQKLGRKTKQKSLSDFHSQSRLVSNVTRMVCSSNKNSSLDVTIDGIFWRRIRYFQISCQWQTHVKLFPLSF